jgi:hypothetical protein
MGYHVSIDGRSQALLELLNKDPGKVFPQRFPAYLLFLVSGDEDQLDWVMTNIPVLEPLSRNTFAFAVFSEQVPVKFRTKSTRKEAQAEIRAKGGEVRDGDEKAVIPAELAASTRRLMDLVEHGKFGVVLDNEERKAITFGTDTVAKALEVVGKLPCLVVLDAVPSPELTAVSLSPELLPSLKDRLRGAVDRFRRVDGPAVMHADADRVTRARARLEEEKSLEPALRKSIAVERRLLADQEQRAAANRSQGDYSQNIQSRRDKVEHLEQKLRQLIANEPARRNALDAEYDATLAACRLHEKATFSYCLREELRAAGWHAHLRGIKEGAPSFVGKILPDLAKAILEMCTRLPHAPT